MEQSEKASETRLPVSGHEGHKTEAQAGSGHAHHGALNLTDHHAHRTNVVYAAGSSTANGMQTVVATLVMMLLSWCSQYNLALAGAQATFIAAEIGGASITGWFGSSQLVSCSTIFPLGAYLSDNIGRTRVLQFGAILGFVGNIVAARANHPGQLIVGLVLAGCSTGFLAQYAVGMTDVISIKNRGLFIGFLDIAGAGSAATAPIFGGLLTSNTGPRWRSCFYLLTALNGAAFFALFLYRPVYNRKKSYFKIFTGMDWIGLLILMAGLTLFLVGVSYPTTEPWSAPIVLGPLITGIIILVIIMPLYTYLRPNGLIPRTLGTFWNYPWIAFHAWLSGWFLYGFLGFLPLLLSTYFGASPVRTGVLQLAYQGVYFVLTPLFAMSVTWLHGSFRPVLSTCFAIGAIGCGALSVLSPTVATIPKYMGVSAILGASSAGTSGLSLVITQYSAIQKDVGLAVGLSNAARAFGGALSIGIFFSTLGTRLADALPIYIPPAVTAAGLGPEQIPAFIGALTSGNAAALSAIPGISPEIIAAGSAALKESYYYGFKLVFWVTAAITGVGFFTTWMMHPIKKERMTDVVPVKLQGTAGAKEEGAAVEFGK